MLWRGKLWQSRSVSDSGMRAGDNAIGYQPAEHIFTPNETLCVTQARPISRRAVPQLINSGTVFQASRGGYHATPATIAAPGTLG